MSPIKAIPLLALLAMASGCFSGNNPVTVTPEGVANECVRLCNEAVDEGLDLSQGPCLGNPLGYAPDWVCDVAHSPREPVDNLAETQCSAYRSGTATHFVEVTPSCAVIRTV